MAVDQALLELGQQPVLRLYQWNEPTLTLGYFQTARSREQHVHSSTCPLLRRSTGGGAIVHDRELTYSLILPLGSYSQPPTQLYDIVHQAVADRLASNGLTARRHPDRPTSFEARPADAPLQTQSTATRNGPAATQSAPFLCFKRRAPGDLIVWPTADQADRISTPYEPGEYEPSSHGPSEHEPDGHKVLGSAQRKRDGAILQHGSVLLERSPHAPQLAGINDFLLSSGRPTTDEWIRELVAAISSALGWNPEPSALTDEEQEAAERLRQTRFKNAAWNLAR